MIMNISREKLLSGCKTPQNPAKRQINQSYFVNSNLIFTEFSVSYLFCIVIYAVYKNEKIRIGITLLREF